MDKHEGIKFKNTVTWEHRDKDGNLIEKETTENLITNAGFDYLAALIGNAAGTPAKYIALTADTGPASAAHTTLATEYTDSGLERVLGDYAHTGGTKIHTVSKTFTCSADNKVVAMAGLFNASSSGSMLAETVAAVAKTLYSAETLAVTWTLTLS